MKIAGIDVNSNHIDVVLLQLDTDHAEYHRRRIDTGPKEDAFQRARRLRDAMPARGAWIDHGVLTIGIEKPMAFGNVGNGIVPQIRVQGALLACLPVDIDIVELLPNEWKKASVGHGRADKTAVATWARTAWLDQPDRCPQDAYDAYAIAWATRARYLAKPQPVRLNTSAA